MKNFILYSSNTRPKYISDILNVLALPKNLEYQFRYKKDYITSEFTHTYVQDKPSLIGSKILICYRDEKMVVPIRWASITEIHQISDFYVIKFSVKEYVCLCFKDLYNYENVCAESDEYIRTVDENEYKYDLQKGFCELAAPDNNFKNDFVNWINTAKVLSLNNTFKNSFFLKIQPLKSECKNSVDYNKDTHHYSASEFSAYNFKITYYSKDFNSKSSKLIISHNSDNIKITTPKKYNLDSRYDSLKIWFNCIEVSENNYTGLKINTSNSNINTDIYIPIFIKKSNKVVWYRIISSFIGAAFIATPSLLPKDSSLILKIALASIGALIIAFTTNYKNPFKKTL